MVNTCEVRTGAGVLLVSASGAGAGASMAGAGAPGTGNPAIGVLAAGADLCAWPKYRAKGAASSTKIAPAKTPWRIPANNSERAGPGVGEWGEFCMGRLQLGQMPADLGPPAFVTTRPVA